MNRQSNTYTVIYAAILVFVVGFVLAIIYQGLRPMQEENITNDTRRQILAAARIVPDKSQSLAELYKSHIVDSYIVDFKGNKTKTSVNPLEIDMGAEMKKPEDKRLLPVFVCKIGDETKYIVPVAGAGLWGPIWGYVAFDANGDTIYGAYFSHQGETPGLGAEIEKPAFSDQFRGKNIYSADDKFQSVAVVKNGQEPTDKDYVHGVTGGTITSQGVQAMLYNSLSAYNDFFQKLRAEK